MANEAKLIGFRPLVTSATLTQSLNVGTLMDEIKAGKLAIPDYQRDSSQWDPAKKSLFIESLINNLTVPPLIVYDEDDEATGEERRYVIDGQQRLTTIQEFHGDRFALAGEADVEYAENVGPIVQGKKFSELPPAIQTQLRRYVISFIVLPKGMDLSLRLEVFRRINEGGVPLSAHDLRLATFGESERVAFIRIAGIFDTKREGSRRMMEAAHARFGFEFPWRDVKPWQKWWGSSQWSIGQAPSEMFLYYIISRDLVNLSTLLDSHKQLQNLRLRYDKTTNSVLDLYCAQLQYESKNQRAAMILAPLEHYKRWFEAFERWFSAIKISGGFSVPLQMSRKLAFFIAAADELLGDPQMLSAQAWESVQLFLTAGPREILNGLGVEYPSTRGKWPGQRLQIEKTYEICKVISDQ